MATFSANCIAPRTSSKVSSIHPIIFIRIIVFSGFLVEFSAALPNTTGDVEPSQPLFVSPISNEILQFLRQ